MRAKVTGMGFVLVATALAGGCKAKESGAKAKAFTVDPGNAFIAPKPRDAWAFAIAGPAKPLTPAQVAAKAGITLAAADGRGYTTTITAAGETVLFLQDKPSPAKPWYSVDAAGKVFAWSFIVAHTKGLAVNPNIYVRHAPGEAPRVKTDANGNGENLYLMHFPAAADGINEPVLVPDAQHFVVAGVTYYRLGNKVFDAVSRFGSLEFSEIGQRIWSYDGDSFNPDVTAGTVFWSPDLKTYFSAAPDAASAVQWSTADGEVLHKTGTVPLAAAKMPDAAARMLQINAGLGLDKRPANFFPRITYDVEAPDRASIVIYQYEGTIQRKAAGLGLTGGAKAFRTDDDYLPPAIRAANARPSGLALANPPSYPRYDPKSKYPDGYHVLVDTPYGPKVGVTSASNVAQKANGYPQWAWGKSDEVSQQILLYDGKPDDLQYGGDGKVDPARNTATQVMNQRAHNGSTTQPYYDGVSQTIAKQNAAIVKERDERAQTEAKFREDTARAERQLAESQAEAKKTDANHTVDGLTRNAVESTVEYAGDKGTGALKGTPSSGGSMADKAGRMGVDQGINKGTGKITGQVDSMAQDGITMVTGQADGRKVAEEAAKDAQYTNGSLAADLQDKRYLGNRAAEGVGLAAGKGVEWIAKPLGPVGKMAGKEVQQDVTEVGKGINTIDAYDEASDSADKLAANRADSVRAQQTGGRFAQAMKSNQAAVAKAAPAAAPKPADDAAPAATPATPAAPADAAAAEPSAGAPEAQLPEQSAAAAEPSASAAEPSASAAEPSGGNDAPTEPQAEPSTGAGDEPLE